MARFKMTYTDYDEEVSTVTIPSTDLTAANIDAEYADGLTLETATEAVLRGKLQKSEHVAKTSPKGVGRATDAEAQREEKALVQYYDSVTYKRATLEMPCADMGLQNPDYPGVFYLQGAGNNTQEWIDWVAAFVAFATGPSGNTPVVEKVVHVGRNL